MIDEKKLNRDDLCDICRSADCANYFSDEDFEKWINSQPTTYSIEKIIKVLEKKADNCQNNAKYYGEKAEWMSKAYRDAIEVIKGGTE